MGGYIVAHGSKTTNPHQLAAEGRGVTVYIFERAATTELGEERCHRGYERSSGPCSTFHFVQGNECNEFRIGDTLIPYVKKTGVFSAGTCASQGYTVAHGSKTTNLHQLAAEGRGVTVYIFEKA